MSDLRFLSLLNLFLVKKSVTT